MLLENKEFYIRSDVENAILANPDMDWYIVQTASKCEEAFSKSVRDHLQVRGLTSDVGMILIPRVKKKDEKGKEKILCSYPSYVFILAKMSGDLVHCIKGASKVMGFIGDSSLKDSGMPKPIAKRDIRQVIIQLPKIDEIVYDGLKAGDEVVITGDINAVIKSVNVVSARAIVTVYLFGSEREMDIKLSDIIES